MNIHEYQAAELFAKYGLPVNPGKVATTPEEAAEHPNKNMLYRALGQGDAVEVDTLTRRLPPKSRLLLCSDGLWNLVEDKEIADVVKQTANPQEACNKLIALANKRGGNDNVTVLLLHMPG